MTTTIVLEITYSQLAIFVSTLSQPYNDWTDRHVSQGFSWRQGSVSFRTLSNGNHLIEIRVVEHLSDVSDDAVRAIEVPFDVPSGNAVEIGSVAEISSLMLKAGHYLLRCEFLRPIRRDEERVCLTFASKDFPRFAIARSDDELSDDGELLTNAQPAVG